jgi:ribosome maturation factor RimP
MRQAPQELYTLIEPVLDRLGYELVGLDFSPRPGNGLLRIYIDSPQGITLDDCTKASHQVSGLLDVEDPIRGPYTLEVSSPGLDRPLFTREHFSRFAGCRVRVQLQFMQDGRRKFTGMLRGVRDNDVIIEEEAGTVSIPLERIAKANLVPEI